MLASAGCVCAAAFARGPRVGLGVRRFVVLAAELRLVPSERVVRSVRQSDRDDLRAVVAVPVVELQRVRLQLHVAV